MSRYDLTPAGGDEPSGLRPAAQPGGWAPEPEPGYAEETIDLRDVVGVLRRHRWLVLSVTAFVFSIAVLIVARQEPEYRARAVLRLQDERGAITGGIAGGAMEDMLGRRNDPILSELQVLRSRAVATEVLTRTPLRLVSDEYDVGRLERVSIALETPADTFEIRFGDDGFRVRRGAGVIEGAYGSPVKVGTMIFVVPERPEADEARFAVRSASSAYDHLAEKLAARPRETTDVVDVEYVSTDPRLAQTVVNTTLDAFTDLNARTAQESSRRRRVFLQEQLTQTDSMLAEVQLALSEFRRRESVFSSRAQFEAEQVGLMGIDVRREEMRADRLMFTSLLRGIETGAGGGRLESVVSAPGIASNVVVSQLYGQLVRYESLRDSLTAGEWGSSATNPDVRAADQMIATTRDRLIAAVRSHIDALDARIVALDELRARSAAQIRELPEAEAEEMRLVQNLETVRAMADQLRSEYQRARIAEAVEVGQVTVVDRAALPVEPIGSGRGLKLALGMVLGLMLGSGGAFLREHMNTALRHRQDVEDTLRVPGLVTIPRIEMGSGERGKAFPITVSKLRLGRGRAVGPEEGERGPHELVTAADLRSSGAEAFRTLRTNLIFSQSVQALKTIAITSSTPGEGKTTTAANLAVTYAQQGVRVLLIDCDLRKPRLHRVFRIAQSPGLTELVLGHVDVGEAVEASEIEGLFVLTSGTLPPNPSELLGGQRMRDILARLGSEFDLIILDTPPLMAAADAAILGARADGTLLVVRAGQTERAAAQHAVQQLLTVGARVIGAVVNDPDAAVEKYGGYYYTYDYYGAGEEVGAGR